MKTVSLACLFLFGACSSQQTTNSNTDTITSASSDSSSAENEGFHNQTICFQNLGGAKKQDTTYIELNIENDKATGIYKNMLFEKDSRKGTFTGTVHNNLVDGTWRFMQEGMQDSLPLKLRISGDMLYQQNYTFSPKDGRQVLADTAKFSIVFNKIDCP